MTKLGRNAPCPCGSGRKYKHCCLAQQRSVAPVAAPATTLTRLHQDTAPTESRAAPAHIALVNFDGEPIVFTTLHFTVTDLPRVRQALDTIPDLRRLPDKMRWIWRGVARTQKRRVLYGWLDLIDSDLLFETNSTERAERSRALVAEHLGALATYRTTTIKDRDEALAAGGPPSPAPQP